MTRATRSSRTTRGFDVLVACVVVAAVLLTGLTMVLQSTASEREVGADLTPTPSGPMDPASSEYVTKLFGGNRVVQLDLQVDASLWDTMIANAASEQYIAVDAVVDGTTFATAGIRPKGNSSLSMVEKSGSDRYSFKLEFDHYVSGQTCYGLDKIALNNLFADATYMKEFLSYDLMESIGVPTPLRTYVQVSVNGEPWGLYLGVEALEDGFAARVYGKDKGELYNVKTMGAPGLSNGSGTTQSVLPGQPVKLPGGDLIYTDNDPASYSAIFSYSVFTTSDTDYARVIAALEKLSTGTDLAKSFDVDEILRYMAAQTIVVNMDSYFSNMQQNYYLHEQDGVLSILPWDYNTAFGGFMISDASTFVNFPIDTPLLDTFMSQRPLVSQLFAVAEYKTRYHQYLQELVGTYLTGGRFQKLVEETDALITPYVESDPTAFYTYDQYRAGVAALQSLGALRFQSVQEQLDGTVPSTTAGQSSASAHLVDPGTADFAALGTQTGSGGPGGGGGPGGASGPGGP